MQREQYRLTKKRQQQRPNHKQTKIYVYKQKCNNGNKNYKQQQITTQRNQKMKHRLSGCLKTKKKKWQQQQQQVNNKSATT